MQVALHTPLAYSSSAQRVITPPNSWPAVYSNQHADLLLLRFCTSQTLREEERGSCSCPRWPCVHTRSSPYHSEQHAQAFPLFRWCFSLPHHRRLSARRALPCPSNGTRVPRRAPSLPATSSRTCWKEEHTGEENSFGAKKEGTEPIRQRTGNTSSERGPYMPTASPAHRKNQAYPKKKKRASDTRQAGTPTSVERLVAHKTISQKRL